MQVSDLFIRRPVFAVVVSLLLIVGGLASLMNLPVREYPQVDRPVVSVSTVYRGASNEVIESRVTEIVEGAVAGIEGIRQITSQSQNDRSSVSIEFEVSRDPEAATSDVRDAVSRITGRLPDGADTPVVRKVDANASAIMWIGVTSTTLDALELSDFLKRVYVDRLSTVPGVANVNLSGERRFAMRVWVDRPALAARGLTVQDLETAIKRQNVELPGGRIESSQREFTVKTDSRLATPEQFRQVIVSSKNGYLVRLGEVAQVEVGPEDTRFEFYQSGETAIGMGVVRQSTANTLAVVDGVRKELEELKDSLPPGTTAEISYDESQFIRASINGVLRTLIEGVALVILVILVFLRDWRSTIVAMVAIPVSIIAACMVMAFFGASINVLTLLAVVLAIGIVVDDAIVEIENVHRRIEEGQPPLLAAFDGAREIGFAVIATTATLMAVFVPLAFMTGNTGKLFREFGITLAASIFFSGVVARTLTPMMCSKLMVPAHGRIQRMTEPLFEKMNSGYRWLLSQALKIPVVILFIGFLVSLSAYGLFQSLPKEFAPTEDRGAIIVRIQAPEGASLDYTRDRVKEIERAILPLQEQGLVGSTLSQVAPGFARPSPVNEGMVIVRLVPWEQRNQSQQDIVRQLTPKVSNFPGARVSVVNPPAFGGAGGFGQPIQFVLGGPDYETLRGWRDTVMQKAQETGKFVNLDSNYRESQPDIRVQIDRQRAADLGVSVEDIGRTLQLMFGETEVSTFVSRGDEYPVIMRARAEDRASPNDLTNTFIRAANGELVPLSSFVTLTESAAPQALNRFDRLRSITIQSSLAPGISIGEGLETLQQIVRENLPPEVRIGYTGQSRDFLDSTNAIYVTFAMALLVVFLVLAAQFESWINPFIIMLTVPLAVTGGLLALFVTGQTLNIYSQIGMILLIGLMTKNGILIVEFSNQLRERGYGVREAVLEASVLRLRPILMTSIAMIGGAVPLAWSTGAGAEARNAIGTVIVGGVTVSTILTMLVVPSIYLLIGGFTKPATYVGEMLERLRAQTGQRPHGEDLPRHTAPQPPAHPAE
ncbi:efflux RND transporter permease subunit [Microvirga arsenatis]|uniref:MMPL family transporter n=1 Tax=Microvirga arsenatis TaxID=2692265 RepID=A0ABW9YZE1_9HYPH|nr:efflux RND transporter permease subunit [Microvirga arsenatis]NBJ12921.1 MMPL family transporter [Microvirga arsenatis]NBJ25756.1 MMPL family transporter [Microvirga arsenatis]